MADQLQEARLEMARREAARRGLSVDAPPTQPADFAASLRGFNVGGALADSVAAVGSSAVATPIAGLEALGRGVEVKIPTKENPITINPLAPFHKTLGQFVGFNNDKAKAALDHRLEAMGIKPKSELGNKAMGVIGEQAGKLDLATDDAALDFAGGNPVGASFAKALPLAALEAAGFR